MSEQTDWNSRLIAQYRRLLAGGHIPGRPVLRELDAEQPGQVDIIVETDNVLGGPEPRLLMGMRFAEDPGEWDISTELLMRLDEFFGASERYARGEVELIDGVWWHRATFQGRVTPWPPHDW